MFVFLLAIALRWGSAKPTFQEAAAWIVGVLYTGYLPTYFLHLPQHARRRDSRVRVAF